MVRNSFLQICFHKDPLCLSANMNLQVQNNPSMRGANVETDTSNRLCRPTEKYLSLEITGYSFLLDFSESVSISEVT